MAIQLEDRHLELLRDVVRSHVDTRVWKPYVFGSRANGQARKFSDVDLGFVGSKPLPSKVQVALWGALDESDLPYNVDVVDLTTTSDEFRKVAQQHMEQLL